MEYSIGTCLGCKKCLYCENELSIQKKTCLCNKTIKPNKKNRTERVKVAYPRVSTPNLPLKQLEYLQESISRFGYSLDTNTKFNFTFCSSCNSAFQRRKSTPNLKKIDSNENNLVNNELINECETIDLEETVQTISFNLVVKPSNSAALPSKWMEIEVLSLDDILVDVHRYVKKLTGDDEIMHSDYLITFKPEKNAGSGAQLVDLHDYKKFLSDYKKLSDGKKNMTIMVSLKKKEKKNKQSKRKVKLLVLYIFMTNQYYIFLYFFREV